MLCYCYSTMSDAHNENDVAVFRRDFRRIQLCRLRLQEACFICGSQDYIGRRMFLA